MAVVRMGVDTDPTSDDRCVYYLRKTSTVSRTVPPELEEKQKKRGLLKSIFTSGPYNTFLLDVYYKEGIANGNCEDDDINNNDDYDYVNDNTNSNSNSNTNSNNNNNGNNGNNRLTNNNASSVNINNITARNNNRAPLLHLAKNVKGGRRRKTRRRRGTKRRSKK